MGFRSELGLRSTYIFFGRLKPNKSSTVNEFIILFIIYRLLICHDFFLPEWLRSGDRQCEKNVCIIWICSQVICRRVFSTCADYDQNWARMCCKQRRFVSVKNKWFNSGRTLPVSTQLLYVCTWSWELPMFIDRMNAEWVQFNFLHSNGTQYTNNRIVSQIRTNRIECVSVCVRFLCEVVANCSSQFMFQSVVRVKTTQKEKIAVNSDIFFWLRKR